MTLPYRQYEAPDPWPPSPEPGSYRELTALAKHYEARYAGAPTLSFLASDHRVIASLVIDSGTVVGLDVRVQGRRFPPILLRAETHNDQVGKERGINQEVQTGDATFDPRVYVETDAPADDVRRVLTPEVRRAVLALLDAHVEHVTLDPRGVEIRRRTRDGRPSPFEPAVFERLLVDLIDVANAPQVPIRDVEGGVRRGAWVLLAVGPTLVASTLWMMMASHLWTPERFDLPLLAIALGVVAWIILRPFVARAVRGDSTSYRRYLTAVTLLFFELPIVALGALLFVNGALDKSAETERHGKITKLTGWDDEDKTIEADVRWDDGGTASLTFADPKRDLRPGDLVTGWFKPGRLGFRWESGRASATHAPKP